MDWTNLPWEICNDSEIARQTGQPQSTVTWHRPEDKPNPGRTAWVLRNKDLLGAMPDWEVAEIVKRSERQVYAARKRLGIPGYVGASNDRRKILPPEIVALFGTMTDREIAKKAGVSRSFIGKNRELAGVAAYKPNQARGKNRSTDKKEKRLQLISKKCKPKRGRGRPPKEKAKEEPERPRSDIDEFLDWGREEIDVEFLNGLIK